jgi:adenylate cyclase
MQQATPLRAHRASSSPPPFMNKFNLGFLKEHLLPAFTCVAVALLLNLTPWLQKLETGSLDQITQFRANYQPPSDPRLITVGIDDGGINVFGQWPWPRKFHGQFMYSVSFGEPAVVAWDILFTEPSAQGQEYDDALAEGANSLKGRTVFGAYATEDNPQQKPATSDLTQPFERIDGDLDRIPTNRYALFPIPGLRAVGLSAFVDTPEGSDGVRRHVPMLQRVGEKVYPSLSLQSLLVFWDLKPEQVRVVLGDGIYLDGPNIKRRIPIDAEGRYFVNYRFGAEGANSMSYAKLMIDYTEHYVKEPRIPHPDLPSVQGKILLVGQFATGLTDNGITPFAAETPLVLVHANAIENILREDYATRVPSWPSILGVFSLGVVGLIFFPKRKLYQQALFAFGVPLAYLGLATLLWIKFSLWIPLLWPVLAFGSLQIFMIVRQLIREQRAKAQIKGMFGTYVSPELVSRMVESGQSPQLGGHTENITAYFSDIQSFSTFSELLPPDKLVELMNDYLTACTDIVQEEGGTLDKYIGDAVVAMFGAPLPLPDHALRACVASQRVHLKLLELRAKWTSEGEVWPPIVREMQSRIGLNSGDVIVGNMGSRSRFNYTMMGDNVNLAARMESGAKAWGVYSLCSEATKLACERDGADRVVFRPLGRIVVKGRSTAVPIHEIVGLKENVTPQTLECLRIFAEGMTCYYARQWDTAIERYTASEKLEPNQPGITPGVESNPSRVYIKIAKLYQVAPPPPEWEGEYVMTSK